MPIGHLNFSSMHKNVCGVFLGLTERFFLQQSLAEFLPEHLGVALSARPTQVGLPPQHLFHAVKRGELDGGNVLQKDENQHVLPFIKQAKAGREVVIARSLIDVSSVDVPVKSKKEK